MTVTLPTSILAGDRLVFVSGHGSTVSNMTFPGGWTELSDSAGFTAAYLDCDGSEAATITVTLADNAGMSWAILRLREYDTTQAPIVGVKTTGTSAAPRAPQLATSWGTDAAIFIVAAGYQDTTSPTFAEFPFGYINTGSISSVGGVGTDATTGYATKIAYTTENPGSFRLSAIDNWSANTIAVKGLCVPRVKTIYVSTAVESRRLQQTFAPILSRAPADAVVATPEPSPKPVVVQADNSLAPPRTTPRAIIARGSLEDFASPRPNIVSQAVARSVQRDVFEPIIIRGGADSIVFTATPAPYVVSQAVASAALRVTFGPIVLRAPFVEDVVIPPGPGPTPEPPAGGGGPGSPRRRLLTYREPPPLLSYRRPPEGYVLPVRVEQVRRARIVKGPSKGTIVKIGKVEDDDDEEFMALLVAILAEEI